MTKEVSTEPRGWSPARTLQSVWLEKKVPEVTLQWEEMSAREPWGTWKSQPFTLLPLFGGGIDDRNGPLNSGLSGMPCLVISYESLKCQAFKSAFPGGRGIDHTTRLLEHH